MGFAGARFAADAPPAGELVALLSEAPANGGGTNGHATNGHAAVAQIVEDGPRRGRNRYHAATPGIPRGRDAVRRIVSERPGLWTLTEIRDEMSARGWLISSKGVEAAAKRLCVLNGEGRHIGPGRYVFPANYGELPEPEQREEDAIESDASGAAMIAFTDE